MQAHTCNPNTPTLNEENQENLPQKKHTQAEASTSELATGEGGNRTG